ncbi:MAG TPA: hypothetical protein VJI74_00670, partial [Candidatus Paceibacterota bacterium]
SLVHNSIVYSYCWFIPQMDDLAAEINRVAEDVFRSYISYEHAMNLVLGQGLDVEEALSLCRGVAGEA